MFGMRNSNSKKRKRSTVVLELAGALLLVETRDGLLLLPGGGQGDDESAIEAAVRELREETTLMASVVIFLFQYESPSNHHSVFWTIADGTPEARDDAVRIHLYRGEDALAQKMSPATLAIVEEFQRLQAAEPEIFRLRQVRSTA